MAAYVGVIGEQEGIDLLLRAMEHIVRTRGRTDLQMVIVGSGPQFASVSELSKRLALSDYVTFTGRVDDDALMTILSTADVCVNPDRPNSMNDKSTMNKVMEYMALGKPVVQFDLAEGRVSAQGASLYARNTDVADFGNKILELVDDPDRRNAMGAIGRERVLSELSWSHEAPKLLAAYDALFDVETELAARPVFRGTKQ
jgi:glycosyltransferase involved in cell wall biosynthesis